MTRDYWDRLWEWYATTLPEDEREDARHDAIHLMRDPAGGPWIVSHVLVCEAHCWPTEGEA
jgi:hypothetical protein